MRFNLKIGNKLLELRKKSGLTQAEAAEGAGISDRAYADIERGDATMRIDTLLKICSVFDITPNDILIEPENDSGESTDILERLEKLPEKNKLAALKILEIYINSVK